MNRSIQYYIGAVALGGLAALTYGVLSLPQSDGIGILVLLAVLSGIAQAASINLFSGSSVSLAFAVSFISLVLFGPTGAILANLGSAAVHAFYPRRRAWYKSIFNTGVFTLSAAAAAAMYTLAGGHWPVSDITSAALPAVVAAVVYFLVNTSLVSLAVSLTTQANFRAVFNENHRFLVLHYLTVAAISLMAAFGYQSMGFPGLVAFSLPLIMPWVSTRMYVSQTKTVNSRNAELTEVNVKLEAANISLQRRIEEMGTLYRIGLALNQSPELEEMLSFIVNSVRDLTKAHGVAIFLFEKETGHFRLGGQVGLSEAYLRQPELSLDGPAKRAIDKKRRILMDGRLANPDFLSTAAGNEGIVAAACLPIALGDEVVGALDITFQEPHIFSDDELTVLETLAEQAAAGIHNGQLYHQLHSTYLSTIAVLVATVEAKDPYTRGHSERVRDLAVAAGQQMRLPQSELNTLELAALFHDIGKIGIPEHILRKNGPLDDEEWLAIKRHPALAESILKHVPTLAATIPIIRAHHERPDGRGYPDAAVGPMSTLAALIAVADAYDAMTSERPYRKALEKDYAIDQLKTGSGKQFDPGAVEAFVRALLPEVTVPHPTLVPEIRLHGGNRSSNSSDRNGRVETGKLS